MSHPIEHRDDHPYQFFKALGVAAVGFAAQFPFTQIYFNAANPVAVFCLLQAGVCGFGAWSFYESAKQLTSTVVVCFLVGVILFFFPIFGMFGSNPDAPEGEIGQESAQPQSQTETPPETLQLPEILYPSETQSAQDYIRKVFPPQSYTAGVVIDVIVQLDTINPSHNFPANAVLSIKWPDRLNNWQLSEMYLWPGTYTTTSSLDLERGNSVQVQPHMMTLMFPQYGETTTEYYALLRITHSNVSDEHISSFQNAVSRGELELSLEE